ncbi:carbohydrate sulfotransferase 1-like [Tachypleus tridentatus]|uniref:carbohydrate sulfotransferase 1-like n=1 Tax=Tachypleus tridentatus TaxID=6853 RepID=UPI003FD1D575
MIKEANPIEVFPDENKTKAFPSTPIKLHIILLTYAGDGSSFLGDIIQSHPGVFYMFEPIHFFGEEIPTMIEFLSDIFRCKFKRWISFLEWAKQNKKFKNLERNYHYWTACSTKEKDKCFDVNFVTSFCKTSLIKVVKVIRFSLNEVEHLLEKNKDLNLKIIHMVRDPRGIMRSRLMERNIILWCKKKLCSDSKFLCNQIRDDLTYACKLKTKFPGKYKLLRYEDLAKRPFEITQDIFQF